MRYQNGGQSRAPRRWESIVKGTSKCRNEHLVPYCRTKKRGEFPECNGSVGANTRLRVYLKSSEIFE
jgi:hypothetical protein